MLVIAFLQVRCGKLGSNYTVEGEKEMRTGSTHTRARDGFARNGGASSSLEDC